MDTRIALADPRRARHSGKRADWAKRKPTLLFRFDVSFLLRFADRRFSGLLFHDPPRTTRPRYWADALRKSTASKIARLKPSVSPCAACPIQACTLGRKSSKPAAPRAKL